MSAPTLSTRPWRLRTVCTIAALTAFPALPVRWEAAVPTVGAQARPAPPRFEVDPAWPAPLPNGWVLGPVCGFVLACPGEPSVYLVGDSILTDAVRDAVESLQPDVVVLPAGAANMGFGGDILFAVDDLVALGGW